MRRDRRRELLLILGGAFDGVVYKDGVISRKAGDFIMTSSAGIFQKLSSEMTILGANSSTECVISTLNAIDLTGYNTLSVTARKAGGYNQSTIGVSSVQASTSEAFTKKFAWSTSSQTFNTYTVDISSLSGAYYIQLATKVYTSNSETHITEVVLT